MTALELQRILSATSQQQNQSECDLRGPPGPGMFPPALAIASVILSMKPCVSSLPRADGVTEARSAPRPA